MGVVYKQDNTQFKYSKKKKTDQALSLEKFMARAGPVMEQILDENNKLRSQEDDRKTKAVEAKQTLSFPVEILIMLGDGEK